MPGILSKKRGWLEEVSYAGQQAAFDGGRVER
jgi:hypothetical protein